MRSKVLSKQEAEQVVTKKPGRKSNQDFYAVLRTLHKGEAVLILKSEWTLRTRPGQLVKSALQREGLHFSCKDTGDEWMIQRVV